MALNKGKAFETHFKEDWKKSFPNTFIYRLPDQMNGYLSSSKNPCDFICFPGKDLFLIECKSHDGASIPFSAISQYDRLLQYKDLPNVKPGIIIWFKEKDLVVWVPIKTAEKIHAAGYKSIGLKLLSNPEYKIIVIPSQKKRVFLDSDYSILSSLGENE